MSRHISIFFVIIFGLFIVTPTVVTAIKSTIDISYVYSVTEEEQSNSERTIAENHTKILTKQLSWALGFLEFSESNQNTYYNKIWKPVYFDLLSPPPEHA